jgi:hypothetical protein
MALFTLDEEHPLSKAGLRFVHVVEQVELGLKPGDVVFEFPYGRIVDTGMACRRPASASAACRSVTSQRPKIRGRRLSPCAPAASAVGRTPKWRKGWIVDPGGVGRGSGGERRWG